MMLTVPAFVCWLEGMTARRTGSRTADLQVRLHPYLSRNEPSDAPGTIQAEHGERVGFVEPALKIGACRTAVDSARVDQTKE